MNSSGEDGAVAVADRNELAHRVERTPYEILALAVEHGATADTVERLVKLAEHVEAGRRKQAYIADMVRTQKAMRPVVKSKDNAGTKTKYAPLEDIERQCARVWQEHGFALSFHEEKADKPDWVRTVCDICHNQGHTERVWAEFPRDGVGPNGKPTSMNPIQGVVSSGSYAMRVLITRIFNIPIVNTDRDGQGDCITATQMEQLHAEMDRREFNSAAFFKVYGIESTDQLPADRFLDAIDNLRKKPAKKGVQS